MKKTLSLLLVTVIIVSLIGAIPFSAGAYPVVDYWVNAYNPWLREDLQLGETVYIGFTSWDSLELRTWVIDASDDGTNVVKVVSGVEVENRAEGISVQALSIGSASVEVVVSFDYRMIDATIDPRERCRFVLTFNVTSPDLNAELTFGQPQPSLDYIAGSLGKLTGGRFSETTLNPTLTVNNDSSSETAANINITIEAPPGFSFDEKEYKKTYSPPPFNLAHSSKREFKPNIYPIYSEEYNNKNTATFTVKFTSSLNDGTSTKDVTINKHTDIEGKIKYSTATGNKEQKVDWTLSNFTGDDSFLCKLSAGLSISVYNSGSIKETFSNLGFSNVLVCSSGTGYGDDVAIASKKVINGDKIETIVAVALRGTIGNKIYGIEWWGNYKTLPKRSPLMEDSRGYHSGFADMFDGTVTQLAGYMNRYVKTSSANTRMLVTGHSRAAAAANILGAFLDETQTWAPRSNIKVYTFATPNVKKNISNTSTYNNIINIVNNADPVPDIPFEWWGYRKFGQTRYFTQPTLKSYNFFFKVKALKNAKNANTPHDMETYLNWAYASQGVVAKIPTDFTEIEIKCPVDIEVQDLDGATVGKIVNNVIIYDPDDSGVVLTVDGDTKSVSFSSGEEYTLRLTGTDTGVMGLSVISVGEVSIEKEFTEVPLTNGKHMEISAGGTTTAEYARLYVTENGSVIEEIHGEAHTLPVPDLAPYTPDVNFDADEIGPSMSNFVRSLLYKDGQFADVNENQWYGTEQQGVIATSYRYGLMQGNSDGTFRPVGNVTVAEALTIAARIHSIYNTGEENFSQGSPWYMVYVDYCIDKGIISANDFTDYTRATTRAEMAYILSRALPQEQYEVINSVVSLPDVATGSPRSESIIALYAAGILTGSDTEGTFNPGSSISRAESAAIISRVILPITRAYGRIYGGPAIDSSSEYTTPEDLDDYPAHGDTANYYEGYTLQFGGISWLVLEVRDGKALLLSEYVLEDRPYNDEYDVCTWESCTLRKYLNGSFYNNSFSAEEKARIADTLVINNDNPTFETSGGNDTTDKVFLLSIEEVEKYFWDGEFSEYRLEGYKDDEYYSSVRWWLRSPGYDSGCAACSDGDGGLFSFGDNVTFSYGVRPSIWLKL